MGFDNECITHIQSLKGEYLCPICRLLTYPDEALQTPCGHLYCRPCLSYVAQTTKICPYDGMFVSECEAKPLVETDRALADTIWQTPVRCLYYKSRCPWEGSLFESLSHTSGCVFGNCPVHCNICGMQILHMQIPQHRRSCPVMHSQAPYLPGQAQHPPPPPPPPPRVHNQVPSNMHSNVQQNMTYSQAQSYSQLQLGPQQLVGQQGMEILLDYAPADHTPQPSHYQVAPPLTQLHTGAPQQPLSYAPLAHPQPVQPNNQQPMQSQMHQYYQAHPPNAQHHFHPQTQPNQPMQQFIATSSAPPPPGIARPPPLKNPPGSVHPNSVAGRVTRLSSGRVSAGLPQTPLNHVSQRQPLQLQLQLQPPQRALNYRQEAFVQLPNLHQPRDGRLKTLLPKDADHATNRERDLGLPGSSVKVEACSLPAGSSNQVYGAGVSTKSMPFEEPAPGFGPVPAFGPSSNVDAGQTQKIGGDSEGFIGGNTDANKALGINRPSHPNSVQGGGQAVQVQPTQLRKSVGRKASNPNSFGTQQQHRQDTPLHPSPNAPIFRSGGSSRALGREFYPGEMLSSKSNPKKRHNMSIMCQICNVPVDDLEMHCRMKEHQQAMTNFIMANKHNSLKKQKIDE